MENKIKDKGGQSSGRSVFARRFYAQLKGDRKLFILTLILQLLGIPLSALCFAMNNINLKNITSAADAPLSTIGFYSDIYILGLISLFLAIIAGAVFAMKNFCYLLNRKETDIVMSLPLSRKQLFLADFLSGLLAYTVPYLIIVLLTLPVWFLRTPTEYVPSYYLMNLSMVQVYIPEPEFILITELLIFIAMLFVYTFTVMITSCCGKILNAVIYLVLSNAAIVSAAGCIKSTIGHCVLNEPYSKNETYEAERLCPAGSLMHVINYITAYKELSGSVSGEINWIICSLTACTICFFTALLIFRYRKAEDTGKNFIVSPLFHAVSALITCSVVFSINDPHRLGYNEQTYNTIRLISSVFTALIIYIVMLVLKERTVKIRKPSGKLLFFAASMAASFALQITCVKTSGYGFSFYNPEAAAVKTARIDFPEISVYEEFTDYAHIKKITDLNRKLNGDMMLIAEDSSVEEKYLSKFPDPNAFTSDYDEYYRYSTQSYSPANHASIYIYYTLKNGKKYSRYYTPVTVNYMESDIYKILNDEFRNEMTNVSQEYADKISDKNIKVFCGRTSFTEELYGSRYRTCITSNDYYPNEYIIKEYDWNMLCDILLKSYEQYYDTEDCYKFQISYAENDYGYDMDRNDQFFLPSEYSDLYEEFLKNSKAEKIKWEKESDSDYSYY